MAAALGALLAGCGSVSLQSSYRDHEITIDGSYDDWSEIEYVEKLGLSIGVANDDEYVYAIIVVRDNELQRRIFRNGMMLWFDPSGGQTQNLGIHYPMALPIDPSERPTMLRPRPTPEELAEKRKKMLSEYEVIADGGRVRKVSGVSIHDVPGIEVHSGGPNGMSVFEYKIPLRTSDAIPYAIGSSAGASIGVGLVTPEFDPEAMGEQAGLDETTPPGGGIGGGRGRDSYSGRSGDTRTRRGTQPMSMSKPVNVWGILQLSSR